MGAGDFFPQEVKQQGVKLSTYFHLLPITGMSGAIVPIYVIMTWTGKIFPISLTVRLTDKTTIESSKTFTGTDVSSKTTWHWRDRLYSCHHSNKRVCCLTMLSIAKMICGSTWRSEWMWRMCIGPALCTETTSSDFVLITTVRSGRLSKRKTAEGYNDEAN
jgi:hypothetical protein